jgi:hypothetical protein
MAFHIADQKGLLRKAALKTNLAFNNTLLRRANVFTTIPVLKQLGAFQGQIFERSILLIHRPKEAQDGGAPIYSQQLECISLTTLRRLGDF